MKRILNILLLIFPLFLRAQTIYITTSADTVCAGSFTHFTAITSGTARPHYHWLKNSVSVGTDSSGLSTATIANGDTMKCLLTNAAGDTLFATSNSIQMNVQTMPHISNISATDTLVCVGSYILLSDSIVGGIWRISDTTCASVTDGIVYGHSGLMSFDGPVPAIDTVFYIVTNSCGSDSAAKRITVIPPPDAFFFLGMPGSANQVCVGGEIIINAGDGIDHQLFSTTGNASGGYMYVTGVRSGWDYLYNIDSNYCGVDSFGVSVNVIARPTVSAILPMLPSLCVGATIQLTDSGANGFPSWRASNGNAIMNGAPGLVKGIVPGTDTITLILSNFCGAAETTTLVTVNPPGLITGPDIVCGNTTVTLKDAWAGGIWSAHDSFETITPGSVTVNISNTDSTVITYTLGSCTVSKKIHILPAMPPITGPADLCGSIGVIYENDLTGGVWVSTDLAVASVDGNGLVTPKTPGKTALIYTSSAGCSTSDTVTVSDPPPAITGDLTLCTNRHGHLHNELKDGKWSSGDQSVLTIDSVSGSVFGVSDGSATITYTSPAGCITYTYISVTYCYREADIYPNPATGIVTIEADTALYDKITITDVAGKTVFAKPINRTFTHIDIHLLPTGIYLVTLSGDNKKYVQKLLKE